MKPINRFFCTLMFICLFAACNDSGSSTETAPATPGVQNVNGNVPDSSTGTTLNQPLPIDSSRVDSTRR